MTDTPPTTTPTKPGLQTTEFYASWFVKILGALLAGGVFGTGTVAERIAGAALALLAQWGYTYSRTVVKTAGALLLVALLAAPQVACSSARSRGAAAASAFLDCESPNVKPLLPDAISLAKAAIMRWIGGSGAIDAAGLKSDAAPLKGDLARCAWDAAIAALAAPAAAPAPGAPAAAQLAIDAGALRARWAVARAELGWPQGRAAP